MINRDENPVFLNDFLDYSSTILNKSPNTMKEYNYDISHFLRFIKYKFNMAKMDNEVGLANIKINDLTVETITQIQIEDIHAFLGYMKETFHSKPATLARKVASIRVFFHYMCNKTKRIPNNPAIDLETPKLDRRLPRYLSLDQSRKLLQVAGTPPLGTHGNHDIKDIDFSENKLNVIGKGNKERAIYLNKACINAINDYLKDRPKEGVKYDSRDALFLSEQRKRISNRTVQ